MSSAYLHPEFGYFCPSLGFRRAARIALVSAVIGMIAGATGVAALISGHAPPLASVAISSRTEALSTGKEPDVSRSSVVEADASSTAHLQPDTIKSDTVKSVAKSDRVKSDAAKVETATPDPSKLEAVKTEVAATSCEANTWAYLDGRCGSGTARKMRIVRTPAISRNTPAAAAADAPVASVTSEPAGRNDASSGTLAKSNLPKSNLAKSNLAKSNLATSTPAPAAVVTAAQSQQLVVAARKPQKSASRQSHGRDHAARNAPSLRDARAQPAEPPASGPFGSGGFFTLFR
jgi:hypothetical protein